MKKVSCTSSLIQAIRIPGTSQVHCEFCDDGTEFTSSATGSGFGTGTGSGGAGTGSGAGSESGSASGGDAVQTGDDGGNGGDFDYNNALNNLASLDPDQDLVRNISEI